MRADSLIERQDLAAFPRPQSPLVEELGEFHEHGTGNVDEHEAGPDAAAGRRILVGLRHRGDQDPTRPEDLERAGLGLAEDTLAIGFVGRLSRQKAIDVLIAAFAPVAKANVKARLMVIGEGEEGAAARQQAERLGCSQQVTWLGAVDALPRYPAFDLFAQPSRYEGFSYAVLEAASRGVAVLTTDVGGSREAITDGVSGLIVPPDAPDAFVAALAALAADPQRLARMGRAAREGMAAVDGRQRMVDATLALYGGLLMSRSEVRK